MPHLVIVAVLNRYVPHDSRETIHVRILEGEFHDGVAQVSLEGKGLMTEELAVRVQERMDGGLVKVVYHGFGPRSIPSHNPT
jgi:hypothetical protein